MQVSMLCTLFCFFSRNEVKTKHVVNYFRQVCCTGAQQATDFRRSLSAASGKKRCRRAIEATSKLEISRFPSFHWKIPHLSSSMISISSSPIRISSISHDTVAFSKSRFQSTSAFLLDRMQIAVHKIVIRSSPSLTILIKLYFFVRVSVAISLG